jgi:hypothetical protein
MSDHIYAYGIVEQSDEPPDPDVAGVGGATVDTIDCAGLSVLVSPIDTTDPDRSDEAVETHNEVLRAVLESGETVVPMQFGMAFESEATLRCVVEGAEAAFRDALAELAGTVELGLKVLGPDADAAQPSALDDEALGQLSGIAVDEADHDRFSDRLALNRAYLVEREQRAAFDDAVDGLEATLGDGWHVKYTGPWPPYSFVDIRIAAGGG